MAKNLPGLNFDSKLSVDDLAFQADSTEKAILDRFQLSFGRGLPSPAFGIRDQTNPRDVLATETTRPLVVYTSPSNSLRINVTPGLAVTPNGAIVALPALVEDFSLVRTLANDIIVVFLENVIIDAPPNRVTTYNRTQPVRRVQDQSAVLATDLLSNFTNPVLFPPTRLDNLVVISVIKVASAISGLELQFDYSNGSYSFNRPWYSSFDVEHRSYLGSGVATAKNIHALSFSDLTSGGFTLYDQLLVYGVVQAKDPDFKAAPGKLCTETLSLARLLTDISGTVTSGSRFGGAGAKYVVLAAYPGAVTAFYQTGLKGKAIAFDWIPETRIVVMGPDETFTSSGATIEYTKVQGLQPPNQVVSNTLAFGTIESSNEVVYTGGVAISDLVTPVIDFEGTGPVPRNFKIFLKKDGSLIRAPELIQSTLLLDDLGTNLTNITYNIFGPSRITVGLAAAITAPTMAITIRLYGTDIDGLVITDDLVFTGTSWVDVALPGVETPGQFLTTSKVYSDLTSIQVVTRTDDGPDSKIVIFAELETETTVDLNQLAQVASCLWDGTTVTQLKDKRKITTVIPEAIDKNLGPQMSGLGGSSKSWVLTEDLRYPKFRDSTKDKTAASAALATISINDYTAIQPGDTITLPSYPTPKVLTAIIAGVPNRNLGQYLASGSNQLTRDDLVATVNFTAFASGFTAVGPTSNPNLANLTATTVGARGNGTTVKAHAVPTSVTVTNAVGGVDAFGEAYIPRHQDYLDSSLPSPSLYDTSSLRNRYLSRGILIGSRNRVDIVVHGLPIPYTNFQLRLRVATSASAGVWLPWQVVSGSGSLFTFTSVSPITRLQIEAFGRFSGYSLYEGDI